MHELDCCWCWLPCVAGKAAVAGAQCHHSIMLQSGAQRTYRRLQPPLLGIPNPHPHPTPMSPAPSTGKPAPLLPLCSAGAKLIFRFEPFILHVECSGMAAAQKVLQVARQAGYRESGAVPSERPPLHGTA